MDVIFSWVFASRFERTKHWYVVAATIIITGIVVSFLVWEFLLGIVLIVFAGVYLLYDINSHPEVRVNVTTSWVSINQANYDYTRIPSFCIVRIDGKPMMLRLKTTIKTVGNIDIFLTPEIDLTALRTYLQSHIIEDGETDLGAIDRILLGLRL